MISNMSREDKVQFLEYLDAFIKEANDTIDGIGNDTSERATNLRKTCLHGIACANCVQTTILVDM